MAYHVYILTNRTHSVLYIGFSGKLTERLAQHKAGEVKGFTQKYNVNKLIYAESYDDVNEAKAREKALKKWNRAWKEELIAKINPEWKEIHP